MRSLQRVPMIATWRGNSPGYEDLDLDRTAYIRAEALRKVYQLREFQATTLKEMVLKNLFTREQVREHVALDGISFELGPGRSLGVIGPNGSGKSTLLKLAAGIIQPTSGTMEVRGRVASFLELGAGFHPEFTGMENIFLQGRILGLSRKEILSQLEGIIEFSGLGDFIHTPTKRYSTGMTVRLGFAIAAYFDADLMLVDEVLAVGDGAFQTQCMDRINQMRREGKSFLFVSHDLSQIEMVADEVLWLDHGRPRMFGKTEEVLQAFEREMQGLLLNEGPQTAVDDMSAALMATVRQGTGEIVIRGVELVRRDGRPARRFPYGEPIVARIDLEVVDPMPEVEIWLSIGNAESRRVAMTHSGQEMLREIPPFVFHNLEKGRHRVVAELDPPRLPPGHYLVSCSVNRAGDPWHFCDIHLRLYRFTVEIPVGKPEEGGEITEREESRSPQKPKRTPLPLYEPPAIWEE